MANTTTGLFQTLTSAVAGLKAPLMLRKSMLSKVYVHGQPVPGTVGKTISINIPTVNEGNVVDIGAGKIQISDAVHTNVNLVINKNMSSARIVRDFDQTLTAESLRTIYLEPLLEEVARKINRSICDLVTSGNFNIHSSITGGADLFTRANIGTAWSYLRGYGVPDDPQNTFFVTSHVPYATMLSDTTNSWIQENVVGLNAAELVQQTARFMPVFGATIDYDPQMPIPSAGTYAGLLFHRNAIAVAPVVPVDQGSKEGVMETEWQPEGSALTFRIQAEYDMKEQGTVLHAHCIYGLAVVRPEYGSFLVTT
jgi:hypothetical protein